MNCEAVTAVRIGQLVKRQRGPVVIAGQTVQITHTACHFGGVRPWFVCPSCERRCGVLYPSQCKQCAGLHHAVEHMAPIDRLYARARKLRGSLGQTCGNLTSPIPAKPKRMRWHTYFRIRRTVQAIEVHIARALMAGLPSLGYRAGQPPDKKGRPFVCPPDLPDACAISSGEKGGIPPPLKAPIQMGVSARIYQGS